MTHTMELTLWDENNASVIPAHLSDPGDIAVFAKQLTERERIQVVNAYNAGSYEMAATFVWGKSMASLKRELGTLGLSFVGELIGRPDIDEDDNIIDILTEKEAIRLAEELGMVSPTEAIRLRHSQELVSHFAQRAPEESSDPMEMTDAVTVFLSCVKSVLVKPKIQAAKKFADFRFELENEVLSVHDERIDLITTQPYFFQRLAVSVLLSGIKQNNGAKLDHCLNNINVLLPRIWDDLKDPEKWSVGTTYSQVYMDGLTLQMNGLKKALMKVKGFDYVPENLRSFTFVKAADTMVKAHEGMENFYNEQPAVEAFEKLGSIIPAPALGASMSALLCICLGNRYGVSFGAKPVAERILRKQSADRWSRYISHVLPGDVRILQKLLEDRPQANWMSLIESLHIDPSITGKNSQKLMESTLSKNHSRFKRVIQTLLEAHYGKSVN